MPKLKLTKGNIDKLPLTTGERVDYWDTELSGFGLRVGKESKTFVVKADVKVPGTDAAKKPYKTVKKVIGRYGVWTPEQARVEAGERIKKIKAGIPTTEEEIIVPTLLKLVERYLNDNIRAKRTGELYRALFTDGRFKEWGQSPVDVVSNLAPDIILAEFSRISKDSGLFAAKLSFQRLQAVLNYGRILYPKFITSNPVRVIGDAKLWPKTNVRTDCLKGNDFKQFHESLKLYNETTRDALLMCLYTGMRNVETSALQWCNLDMVKENLLIPITKNGKPLNVPLSKQAMSILKRRLEAKDGSEYVFPAQSFHNKQPYVLLRAKLLKTNSGLDISVHGLRRSFVTVGEKLKIRRQDIDLLTNHLDKSITGEHYACTDLDDLRQPLQAICNEIERLMIHGIGGKVIELATAKTA